MDNLFVDQNADPESIFRSCDFRASLTDYDAMAIYKNTLTNDLKSSPFFEYTVKNTVDAIRRGLHSAAIEQITTQLTHYFWCNYNPGYLEPLKHYIASKCRDVKCTNDAINNVALLIAAINELPNFRIDIKKLVYFLKDMRVTY